MVLEGVTRIFSGVYEAVQGSYDLNNARFLWASVRWDVRIRWVPGGTWFVRILDANLRQRVVGRRWCWERLGVAVVLDEWFWWHGVGGVCRGLCDHQWRSGLSASGAHPPFENAWWTEQIAMAGWLGWAPASSRITILNTPRSSNPNKFLVLFFPKERCLGIIWGDYLCVQNSWWVKRFMAAVRNCVW